MDLYGLHIYTYTTTGYHPMYTHDDWMRGTPLILGVSGSEVRAIAGIFRPGTWGGRTVCPDLGQDHFPGETLFFPTGVPGPLLLESLVAGHIHGMTYR
jgi:hypothetical protein